MALNKSTCGSRYNSFNDTRSDPYTELKPKSDSAFKRLISSSSSRRPASAPPIVNKVKSSHILATAQQVKNKNNDPNLVKKFMMGNSNPKKATNLVIPVDFIAQDLKKNKEAKKESSFAGLYKKLLFTSSSSGSAGNKGERKALTEVKSNTRTLAMVLRSERELLAINKDHESQIHKLNSMLDQKNTEVEKLKDLCLKQREEIRSLKSAVLFPDTMNLELEELLEKQGSELRQAKQLIPNLQRQVTSLTGQLHCLAVDLAEVKTDKYSTRPCYEAYVDSPKTPTYDQQDATNSLEFSSEDQTAPGSPDDMFIKDFNPCLTPYSKTKSNEFHELVYESPRIKSFLRNKLQLGHDIGYDPYLNKLSKSSDCCHCSNSGYTFARTGCRSDETKSTFGKQMR